MSGWLVVLAIIGYALVGSLVLKIAEMIFGEYEVSGEVTFFCWIGWPITIIILCCLFMYNLPENIGVCFSFIFKAIRFILGR